MKLEGIPGQDSGWGVGAPCRGAETSAVPPPYCVGECRCGGERRGRSESGGSAASREKGGGVMLVWIYGYGSTGLVRYAFSSVFVCNGSYDRHNFSFLANNIKLKKKDLTNIPTYFGTI